MLHVSRPTQPNAIGVVLVDEWTRVGRGDLGIKDTNGGRRVKG